jgi:hypothetical protein
MAGKETKMWRVGADLAERVDRLTPLVEADPVLGKGGQLGEGFARGDLLRLLLLRGLASVEGEVHARKGKRAE